MESEKRHIVVTGATRGLGRALAKTFGEMGHRVSGCGRSAGAVKALNDEATASASYAAVDVTDEQAVGAWAKTRIEAEGPPDLLINNAGRINRHARLWEVPPEEFRLMWEVNVLGVFYVCRAFLPSMVGRGAGVVVNFSTGAGVRGFPEIAPYCTTKHAVEGFTKSLARELPAGMAAIPFQPGVIRTDMLRGHYGERADDFPEPEVWAKTAAPFLLELSAKENGQSIRLPQVV